MKYRQMLVDESKWNIKCPYKMEPEYITVHNTANDASAENEVKYMISNNQEVSFHYAVDDKEAVQGVLTDRNTWNAGDGANGTGNRKSIAVEICYSKSGGERFIQAEKNAAIVVADLLKGWDLGLDRVRKHQDWNGKYCPHRTLDMGWDRFLKMVSDAYYGKESNASNNNQVKTLYLPATADKWRVYPLDKDARVGNEIGFIFPKKFGGLTYSIISMPRPDVAIIETRDYGKVQIYVDPSTKAVIK